MAVNLAELCKNYFNDDVLNEAAALVHENPAAVKSAINQMIPVFLSGLAEYESSDPSGQSVLNLITASPINTGMLNDLASIFNNKENIDRLNAYGEPLLKNMFGIRLSNIEFSLSQSNGIHLSSAKTLMNLVAPTILGILNNHESVMGLNGNELMNMLETQGFSRASVPQQKTFATQPNSAKPKSNMSWLGWLIGIAIVVLLIGFLVKSCNHPQAIAPANDSTATKSAPPHADTGTKPSDTSAANPY